MAARTTASAGDWNTSGTWTGGVKPGNGDTATLNHAVTVSGNEICGTSPGAGAGTPAIRCNASLTIQNGGTMTCRGDVELNNVPLNLDAGSTWEFDAHLAGTPATALYVIRMVNANDPLAIITITGTSGNHAIMRSNAGGGNGRITNNGNDRSGLVQATYCDFTRIGDGSNAAMDPIDFSSDTFSLANCTLTACGAIGGGVFSVGFGSSANFVLSHVRFTSSPGDCVGMPFGTPSGSPTRNITFCDFDGLVQMNRWNGFTVDDNIFRDLFDAASGPATSFKRNIIAMVNTQGPMPCIAATVQDNYVVFTNATVNPHYLDVSDAFGVTRVTGNVFDTPNGTDGSGDSIAFNAFSALTTVTVDHNLVLHISDTDAGTMISCLGNANVVVDADHNTYHGGQGLYVGETYNGHTDMLNHARSNLSYSQASNLAYIAKGDSGSTVQDVIHSANAHHNGVWHPINTTGYGAFLTFSSGTPGANDVSGDPQFVDINRNMKTWDTSIGGPGTVAHALDQIGTGAQTPLALLTWVKAGFAPQNAAFHAAHDNVAPSNGWMGAVEGTSGAPTTDQIMAAMASEFFGASIGRALAFRVRDAKRHYPHLAFVDVQSEGLGWMAFFPSLLSYDYEPVSSGEMP